MTTHAEERVLKPLDPVPSDVNEWPDFTLREVKIFYQGKGRYADLLEASPEIPLCVLGELMPLDDEQENLALLENHDYARIKIDNVTNYSFGQDDSGKPVIWAAGKAGWYEVMPSDRYLQHYNDTIEAIDLFYFMVDQHNKLSPKRKRLGFQVDPFLTAYQKHTDFRIDDDDEAMETIHKHHRFLLKQMMEEREDIDWSQTHLWKHLAETYVDEIDDLRRALAILPMEEDNTESSSESSSDEEQDAGKEGSEPPAAPVTANGVNSTGSDSSSQESDSDESEDGDEAEGAVQTQTESKRVTESVSESASESSSSTSSTSESESESASKSEPESESESEIEEDQTAWVKPIFELLNVLRKMMNFDIRNCGIEQLATEVVKMPTFNGSHKKAVAVIERCAEPLLRLMNEAKLRKKFNWSTRAIYAELEATLADDIAEDIRTPAVKNSKAKHRMKSVLRPSGAFKSRKRTRPVGDEDDEEMADIIPLSATSPAGKRQPYSKQRSRNVRGQSTDTAGSRDDSPSRQLNGLFDSSQLVELPPGPEAQEMIDLVVQEGRKVGRQNQTGHLQAFLAGWEW